MKTSKPPFPLLLKDLPLAPGHPEFDAAQMRASLRGMSGSMADALKTEDELLAEELLAVQVRRAESSAATHAAKQLAQARVSGIRAAATSSHDKLAVARERSTLERKREDLLTPLIRQALSKCSSSPKTAEVWIELQQMAEGRRAPFIGVSEDGLKYKDELDEVQFFTKKKLKDRLRR